MPLPMEQSDSPPVGPGRRVFVLAALAVLLILLGWQVRKLLDDPTIFPPDDFVEYWAAGKLNLQGKNPYDEEHLHDLQTRETTRHEDFAVMMWNPPWTLTFVMPYGLLPSRDGQLLWLLQNLILTLICGDWLWRLYGGPVRLRWVSWLMTLAFIPTVLALGAGQIPPLILVGITLFLALERKGWDYLAGAATVLIAVKPHLTYLFWIALLVWGLRGRWRVLVGGAIAGLIATAIPMLFNPHVLSQYWEAITHRPPSQWLSPTLGTVIRILGDLPTFLAGREPRNASFALQFIPTALGLIFLGWYTWRTRAEKWDWLQRMPLLLLVSFVTASYGAWPYDVLILLPAVMQVAAQIAQQPTRANVAWGVCAYLAVNVPAVALNLGKVVSFWFIWMAPLLLVLYLLLLRRPAEPALDWPLRSQE
jgi:hypothetical protein